MRLLPLGYALIFLVILFIASASGIISPVGHDTPTLPQENASAAEASEKVFAHAKDSVLRIGVKYSGTIAVPGYSLDPKTFELSPLGTAQDISVQAGFLGTGFVVNPNGYIITNAHVVDTDPKTIEAELWSEYSYQLYEGLVATLPPATDQTRIDEIHAALLSFITERGIIKDTHHTISVFNPAQKAGDFHDFIERGFAATVTQMGQPYPQTGHDIAVIKVDKTNLKSLRLGDATKMLTGSKIFAIGYPGAADLNASSVTEPTLTSGIVSAIKQSPQGNYNVIQIDANISHGNSGGPVFNSHGEVVGIATFGGSENEGFNFILPINLAKADLSEHSVSFSESKTGWASFLARGNTSLILLITGASIIILALLISLIILVRRRKAITQKLPTAPLPPQAASVPPAAPTIPTPAPLPALPSQPNTPPLAIQ